MFERILNRMREKVRALQYVMTIHAEEEMNDDGLSIFDVEQVILTGQIVERQREAETDEWKYLIQGKSTEGVDAVVVSKLSPVGSLVIITVYVE
jgi:aspartate aminotransferase-like enzyme